MINIFLLFYMCHFTTGLTHRYKTTAFYILYLQFSTLYYTFRQMLLAISAAGCKFLRPAAELCM